MAVSGKAIVLKNDQALRALDSSGSVQSLFKLDSSSKFQLLKLPQVSADPSEGNDLARKSFIDSQLQVRDNRLTAVEGRATDLEDAMSVVQGDDSTEGSIAKAKKDALDYVNQKISDLIGGAPQMLDTLKELADAIANDPQLAAHISSQIGSLSDRLDVLEGDSSVAGSVLHAVEEEKQRALGIEGGLRDDLSTESQARSSAVSRIDTKDAQQDERISSLEGQSVSGSTYAQGVYGQLSQEIADRRAAILQEVSDRNSAISDAISQEVTDRNFAISQEASSRNQAISQAIDTETQRADAKYFWQDGSQPLTGHMDAGGYKIQNISTLGAGIIEGVSNLHMTNKIRDPNHLEQDGNTESMVLDVSARKLGSIDGTPVVDFYSSEEFQHLSDVNMMGYSIRGIANAVDPQDAVAYSQLNSINQSLGDRLDVLEQDPTSKTYVDNQIISAKGYADQKVADLVASSPSTLDTLKELADALGSDPNFATTVTNNIGNEATARANADSALSGRLNVIEGSGVGSVAKALVDAKAYTDQQEALDLRLDGRRAMTGALDMGSKKIIGMADPTLAQDAVTKSYADTALAGKASTTLNNLGTTAINSDLLPATDASKALGSLALSYTQLYSRGVSVTSATGVPSSQINHTSGQALWQTVGSSPAAIKIQTGNNSAAASSAVFITTGSAPAGSATGAVTITTSAAAGSGASGNISIATGTVATGTRGSVSITGSSLILNSIKIQGVANGSVSSDAAAYGQVTAAQSAAQAYADAAVLVEKNRALGVEGGLNTRLSTVEALQLPSLQYVKVTVTSAQVASGQIDVGSSIVGTPFVMREGVMGRPGVDFTVSGSVISMGSEWAGSSSISPIAEGDEIFVYYMKMVSVF